MHLQGKSNNFAIPRTQNQACSSVIRNYAHSKPVSDDNAISEILYIHIIYKVNIHLQCQEGSVVFSANQLASRLGRSFTERTPGQVAM